MGKKEGKHLTKTKRGKLLNTNTIVVGGLHSDDFDWAVRQYEDSDYLLVGFELDRDGCHWKAIYAKADYLEKISSWRGADPSLGL